MAHLAPDGAPLFPGLARDLKVAARSLLRAPGFAVVVVLTLALGIGGTTAVFSVVQGVLLAPLPYEEPGRLVRLYQQEEGAERTYVSGPHYLALRTRTSSFEDVAALYTYSDRGVDLGGSGAPRRLRALEVSSEYFRVLRAAPNPGRAFSAEEDQAPTPVAIVSHDLWRRRLNGDPDVIGRSILLSAEPYTVVGVAPAGLRDPVVGAVDVWLPRNVGTGSSMGHPENHHLTVLGRLRSGVTLAQAEAELASLDLALAEEFGADRSDPIAMAPLQEDLVVGARGTLNVLLAAVALLLLVACVNVANLFLVRSTGRSREFAIRSALGSGGVRIARQLLVESVFLSTLGGLLGLALAAFGVDALRKLGGAGIPRLSEVGFDVAVLAFAALVTVATGIAFGVAPALRFGRTQPSAVLREQGRSTTGSRAQGRLRSGLATAQVALALVLLAGAGVLLTSFQRLRTVDLGFATEGVLTFEVHLPLARYDAPARAAFQEALSRRLEELPRVRAAGGTSRLPGTGSYHGWSTYPLTGPRAGEEIDMAALAPQQRVISGSYFEAMGIRLLEGRTFDARDTPREVEEDNAVIVSAKLAETLFPGVSALGHRITMAGEDRTIVGVVEDVALTPTGDVAGTVYHAHSQFAANRNWALTQAVATSGAPDRILPAVRAALADMDPELVLHRPAPLDEVVGRGIARERFTTLLLAAFAAVALVLAALGLYGVLAYAVRQRTQEIGIRIALGATGWQVRSLVLRQAAKVAGVGLLVGLVGALALGRLLSSLVYQTNPADPLILGAVSAVLAAVAFLAAWLPARRAACVEPKLAMQEE